MSCWSSHRKTFHGLTAFTSIPSFSCSRLWPGSPQQLSSDWHLRCALRGRISCESFARAGEPGTRAGGFSERRRRHGSGPLLRASDWIRSDVSFVPGNSDASNLGFEPHNLLTFHLLGELRAIRRLLAKPSCAELHDRLSAIPGVRTVTAFAPDAARPATFIPSVGERPKRSRIKPSSRRPISRPCMPGYFEAHAYAPDRRPHFRRGGQHA